MATASDADCIAQIGETAGQVWKLLADHGPQSTTKLVKEISAPRDVVMQAIGWLAREDKIVIDEGPRARMIALR